MVLCLSVGLLLLAGCGKSAPAGPTSGASGVSTGSGTGPTPPVTPTHQPGGPIQRPGGVSNVRLPATFTMRAGGALDPASISAPPSVPVVLTVISGDSKSHQVTAEVPSQPRTLGVPPRGRASTRMDHLPNGSYPILVDGHVRAHLVIGVQPGP